MLPQHGHAFVVVAVSLVVVVVCALTCCGVGWCAQVLTTSKSVSNHHAKVVIHPTEYHVSVSCFLFLPDVCCCGVACVGCRAPWAGCDVRGCHCFPLLHLHGVLGGGGDGDGGDSVQSCWTWGPATGALSTARAFTTAPPTTSKRGTSFGSGTTSPSTSSTFTNLGKTCSRRRTRKPSWPPVRRRGSRPHQHLRRPARWLRLAKRPSQHGTQRQLAAVPRPGCSWPVTPVAVPMRQLPRRAPAEPGCPWAAAAAAAAVAMGLAAVTV